MIGLHKDISTPYFDGARGIAVLLVWLSHTSGRDQGPAEWLSFHGIGHVGVMLFFALSGYLLAIPFIKNPRSGYKSYLARRIFRIVPLYYLVVSLVFIHQEWTGSVSYRYLHISDGLTGYMQHLFFIRGEGIFWTIAAEFVFYFALPFIAVFLVRGGYKAMIVLIVFSFVYSGYHLLIYLGAIDLPGLKIVDIKHSSQFLDVFVIGVAFGFLSQDSRTRSLYRKNRHVLDKLILSLFVITILITFVLVGKRVLLFSQPFYNARYFSFAYAIIFGATLLSANYGNEPLRRLLCCRLFIFCGVVGYSWYLLHMPVLEFVNHFALPAQFKFLLSTVLISILSLFSYLIIEEPFIKIGKRHFYRQALNASKNGTAPT